MQKTTTVQIDHLAKSAIDKNPHTKPADIVVRIDSGCLTLTGQVDSFFTKQMAQESLRGIDGITEINNQLEVIWN